MSLTGDLLAELVPEIGPRAKLQKALQELKGDPVCLFHLMQRNMFTCICLAFQDVKSSVFCFKLSSRLLLSHG